MNPGIETTQPYSVMDMFRSPRAKITGAMLVAGLALAGCTSSGEHKDALSASPTVTATDSPQGIGSTGTPDSRVEAGILDANAVANATLETDQTLSLGNYACGGEKGATSTVEFSYKVDFYNNKPELSQSFLDNLVTDSKWGMGQEAFDFMKAHSFVNTTTKIDNSKSSEDLKTVEQRIFSVKLNETQTFVNSDCLSNANELTMPSPIKPVIRIEQGSSVEGMVLSEEDYAKFEGLVNKYPDGSDMFASFRFKQMVNGVEQTFVLVATAANGCDNSIRELPPAVRPPKSTPPSTHPTTPPTTHPTTPPSTPHPTKIPDTHPGGPAVPPTVETPPKTEGAPAVEPPPAVREPGDPNGGSGTGGVETGTGPVDNSDAGQTTAPTPNPEAPAPTPTPVCGTGNPLDC